MPCNRIDFLILYMMKESDAKTQSSGMTLKEFPLDELQIKVNTLQKKMKKLEKEGLVKQGYRDMQAYTYYITEKGLKILDNNT